MMSTSEILKMLYKECQSLDLEDATELIIEAKTPEEQEFYSTISDLVLQQRQKKVIEAKEF